MQNPIYTFKKSVRNLSFYVETVISRLFLCAKTDIYQKCATPTNDGSRRRHMIDLFTGVTDFNGDDVLATVDDFDVKPAQHFR